MSSERELRASIAAVGPLLPVLVWAGRVVDGEKRDRICGELGLVPRTVVLHTLQEVCTALWAVHPDRAVLEAVSAGSGASVETRTLAALCSASVADVALLLSEKRNAARVVDKRSPRRTRSTKTELIQFWAEPQFKHYVQRAGELEGLDLSSALRVAAWEYVQRTMPRAATAGSARAPAVEWVKPSERRRRLRERAPR